MECLVGAKAPVFTANCVNPYTKVHEQFNLENHLEKGPVLLFFYPLNFTFVCPTELVALDKAMREFKDRGVTVATISVDSTHAHSAWQKQTPDQGGIGEVSYYMVSDHSRKISKSYGVLGANDFSLRATIYIDQDGIIQYLGTLNAAVGRNIDEILRIIDAFNHHKKYGEVCPINWSKGESGMHATNAGVISYMKNQEGDSSLKFKA